MAELAADMVGLGLVLLAFTVLSSFVMDWQPGIPAGHAAIGALAMGLIGIQHAWLALAVGAATGRPSPTIAVAGTLAVMGYLLHVVGALIDAVEPWQPLSPFAQAIGSGAVSGTVPAGFAWLALAALVFIVVALPQFNRRDIAIACPHRASWKPSG